MTRSIGDLELKPFGVTAVPDVRKIKVSIYSIIPEFMPLIEFTQSCSQL